MKKPRLAITGDFSITNLSELGQNFTVEHITRPKSYADITQLLSACEYYILGGPEYLDKNLLASAKSLTAVAVMGTGTASFIDIGAAQESGIAIYNVPQVNAESVAEFAYSVIYLSQANIFSSIDKLKRKSDWLQTPRPRFSQTHVGIVGLGACARALVLQLRKNGVSKISYYSRTRDLQFEIDHDLQYLELTALAKKCDVISIHVAMNETSHHLVAANFFQQAHASLKLFNFSNPNVVEPQSLKKALLESRIDFFFIDGYYKEWVDVQSDELGFLDLGPDKFAASSHIAAQEVTVIQNIFQRALSSIQSHHQQNY